MKKELLFTTLLTSLIIFIVWALNNQYGLYLIRWQMSSVILSPVIGFVRHYFDKKTKLCLWGSQQDWIAAILANLIGGLVIYWYDLLIIFK